MWSPASPALFSGQSASGQTYTCCKSAGFGYFGNEEDLQLVFRPDDFEASKTMLMTVSSAHINR